VAFLKWAGGKTRYADRLLGMAPPYTGRYWEPFMGSAAVFFAHRPSRAVLSDANEELVVCFQQVAKDPAAIMSLLDGMANNPETFSAVRRQSPADLTDPERAARVVYLNKTSFRGLWRVNRRGDYNAPYGAYDRPYYSRSTMMSAADALARAEVRLGDFDGALRGAEPGDWVYLDPPYVPLGGFSDFKRYTAGQFGIEDHHRLAAAMKDATARGVLLTMTNSDTPETREIFADFPATPMATRRDINLRAGDRDSWDLVFTNYECTPARP
jgi:DNA adenine methylase